VWFVFFVFVTLAFARHRLMRLSARVITFRSFAEWVRRVQHDEVVKATGPGERFAYTCPRKITDVNHLMDLDPFDRLRRKRHVHLPIFSTT
jgi:hypothetical protein